MKSFKYLLPFLLSQSLLICFLGYFLFQEYQDEKAKILAEDKFEFITQVGMDLEKEPVKWVKDSTSNSGYRLVVIEPENDVVFIEVDATERFRSVLTTIVSRDKDTLSHNHFGLPYYLKNSNSLDSNIKHNNFPAIFEPNGEISNFSITIDSFEGTPKTILELVNNFDGKENVKLSKAHILKQMTPQILLSVLLLLLTLLTHYILRARLREEKKLSSLRNDFMSNMSHELKTPVSTISVALEALSNFDAADNKKMREEYIDISKHEINRLGLLVDKALNISLFEQGKFIHNKQKVELDFEIQSILKILKVQLDNSNVTLDYTKKGDSFWVHADKTHLTNVIHNLIENALKYSTQNPEINIALQDNGQSIVMSIDDNGIGIPSQFHDKIFDKFFRVPQGNKHNTKGHGLGLSYVKEVIEKHGGTIKLKSGEGVGSSFIISLPKLKNT